MDALPAELERILEGTSRSFYLTLRVAPGPVRSQLALSYLFCRAADTIADTALLPAARRAELLALYRLQFEREAPDPGQAAALGGELTAAHSIPEERDLLSSLEICFRAYLGFSDPDRRLIRRLVSTLTRGMEMDLASFPPAGPGESAGDPAVGAPEPRALADEEALDRYCYHVAGCVGEFWTDLAAAHLPALAGWDLPAMRTKGIRFGKGLQMTNVLRDLSRDLRNGRCYVPRTLLETEGVQAADLRGGGSATAPLPARLLPLLSRLLDLTLEHYRSGWEYTLAIPPRAARLRLACAWPLLIGLSTLSLLRSRPQDLLRGANLKIPRARVWRIVAASGLRVFSDRGLDALYRRLVAGALAPRVATRDRPVVIPGK